MIDREIVDYISMVMKGVANDNSAMGLDAIREVVQAGGGFIEHETTLKHCRDATWDPLLFSHIGLKGALDVPPLAVRALDKAKQHIGSGDYILPETDRRILEAIYHRAARRLASSS